MQTNKAPSIHIVFFGVSLDTWTKSEHVPIEETLQNAIRQGTRIFEIGTPGMDETTVRAKWDELQQFVDALDPTEDVGDSWVAAFSAADGVSKITVPGIEHPGSYVLQRLPYKRTSLLMQMDHPMAPNPAGWLNHVLRTFVKANNQ